MLSMPRLQTTGSKRDKLAIDSYKNHRGMLLAQVLKKDALSLKKRPSEVQHLVYSMASE
jgi:hypothetical protein